MPKYTVCVARPTCDGWERVEIGNMLIDIASAHHTDPSLQPYLQNVLHMPISRFPTAVCRNVMVNKCLQEGYDFLFMIDVDGSFKDGTFQALFHFLRQQAVPSVVGVPYCSGDGRVQVFHFTTPQAQSKPLDAWKITHMSREMAANRKGFERVASIGTHGIMFDMRVFDKVKKPYFKYNYNDDMTEVIETEDCYCMHQLFNVDVPVYCAWDFPAKHYKESAIEIPMPVEMKDIPEFWQRKAEAHLQPVSRLVSRNGQAAHAEPALNQDG